MQTYSEFKSYITSFIWRQNDADLANDLDKIVRMADAELNRVLNIQRREVSTDISPQLEDFSLPADFYQMRSVTNNQLDRQVRRTAMRNTTFDNIQRMRAEGGSLYIAPYYHTRRAADANTLYLVGPFSSTNPGDLTISYRTAIPDFQAEDESWLEADYLDLYLYAVLKHVGIYLREDDRIQTYDGLMTNALATALDEDKREVQFGGSPIHMKPTRHVPQTRRR